MSESTFTNKALGHLGKRFFVESLSKSSGAFAFLGRLISFEVQHIGNKEDPERTVSFHIKAKPGYWKSPDGRIRTIAAEKIFDLAKDWVEADQPVDFELHHLVSTNTVVAKALIEGVEARSVQSIVGSTYQLVGYDEDKTNYKWVFIDD